jgi:single-stranded-DNA-specific exonuclease
VSTGTPAPAAATSVEVSTPVLTPASAAARPASSTPTPPPIPAPIPTPRWISPEPTPQRAAELAREANLDPLIAAQLIARGIHTADEAARFLHPRLDQLLDPYTMLGMDRAVARVQQAIDLGQPILIYGDYDVDGTTAVVLLKTAIEMLGGTVRFHIPHRLREGYGMQREVLETAAREGVRLVISVDTGIRAFAAADAAEELGLDLIVTDHHLPDAGLPRALAVLNPNQSACAYACKHLCGAGVAFKLAQALLEARDRERARSKTLPSFLKLLAIATVADAVPLLGENRVFVALGLAGLAGGPGIAAGGEAVRPIHPGLRALLQVAELDPSHRRLTSVDIGYRLGPRINAAGRMDIASEVVELFTTRDAPRALAIAQKLEQLNQDRRASEAHMLAEIVTRLGEDAFRETRCIVIDGEGWHRGIIGILAARIVEQTGKPALVVAHEDGEAYGSGRSIPGFHLLDSLEHCRELFTRFGGHAHAVGFSLPSDRVSHLRDRLRDYAALHLTDADLGAPLLCHAELPFAQITPQIYSALRQLEPFGMGNEEPVFVARNLRLAAVPRIMKERHIRLQLVDDSPARTQSVYGNASLCQTPTGAHARSALGWNWAARIVEMDLSEGARLDLAYTLRHNDHPDFGGIELEIAGLRKAQSETRADTEIRTAAEHTAATETAHP